jgi:hypothetical protein
LSPEFCYAADQLPPKNKGVKNKGVKNKGVTKTKVSGTEYSILSENGS